MIQQPGRLKKYIFEQLISKFDLLDFFDFIDNDRDPLLFYRWVEKWRDHEFSPTQRLLVIDTDSDYYPEDQLRTYGNNCYNFFNSCRHFNISTEFIIFVSGSFNKHKEIYSLCDLFNLTNPQVVECLNSPKDTPVHSQFDEIEYNSDRINKLFSCLNGTLRPYRLLFLCYLRENNLLDLGHVTYHFKESIKNKVNPVTDVSTLSDKSCGVHLRTTYPFTRTHEHYKYSKEEIRIFEKHANEFMHKNFNYPALEKENIWDIQLEFLQSSLINIVTESAYHYPHQHPSEKLLKPIGVKRPFIIVGPAGLLKELQEFGFKTFNECWDETYDDLRDPSLRMSAIIDVLNNFKTVDVLWLAEKIKPIVEFNFNHYKNNFIDTGVSRWL